MRKLPEYFAIKRKKKDPRWKQYIAYLNGRFEVSLDGTSNLYPYYGYAGSNHLMDMYHSNPASFLNTVTVMTLDEFFECFFGSNTSQDANSTFPAKWCIKDGLSDSVTEFFNENGTSQYSGDTDGLLHYPAYHGKCLHNNILAGYTEISLPEFQEHVLKETPNKSQPMAKTYQVKKAELEQIHTVACGEWKTRIAELTLRNPFGQLIELTQTEVDNMFAAATESQRPVLVAVFGEPNTEIDLSSNMFDRLLLFERNGTDMSSMISVRLSGEMQNKAFYLNSRYQWEIKPDAMGEMCLVPTRK